MRVEATAARRRHTITVGDGTEIFFKDWGAGQPIVFSHGSPLNSDAWEDQMVFLADNGYRCIAHDRRGHGRSSQPWTGNDVDTYADDLAASVPTTGSRRIDRGYHRLEGPQTSRRTSREALA